MSEETVNLTRSRDQASKQRMETVKRTVSVLLPFFLAAGFTLIFSHASELFGFLPGICKEVLAGTTEGRQAFWGSCWQAPLMTLCYLPFPWLFSSVVAARVAAFCSWLALFYVGRKILQPAARCNRLSGLYMFLLYLSFAIGIGCGGLVSFAIPFALLIYAAVALSNWSVSRQISDIVRTGMAGGLLILCGAPFFLATVFIAFSMILVGLGGKESAKRFQAWLLLGGLPILYTISVWFLLDELVFDDPCYFLRSIPQVISSLPIKNFLLLLAAVWLLVWICSWFFRQKKIIGVVLFFCVIFTFVSQLFLFRYNGISLNSFSIKNLKPLPDLCKQVEADVKAKTKYGRVFVLGYAGLHQLDYEKHSPIFQSNMDLHLSTLRKAFQGQTLFVLCPEPKGILQTESVFWRYPNFYKQGAERMLFAGSYGSWNLYQMVTAPTQEQIDSWKNR